MLETSTNVDVLTSSGGDVMTAMYGVLAAMPMLWGYAGYVLVSHPGTEETGVSRRLQRIMARAAK
jgi:hypothetical protein